MPTARSGRGGGGRHLGLVRDGLLLFGGEVGEVGVGVGVDEGNALRTDEGAG